jgi:hypothetical protein
MATFNALTVSRCGDSRETLKEAQNESSLYLPGGADYGGVSTLNTVLLCTPRKPDSPSHTQ